MRNPQGLWAGMRDFYCPVRSAELTWSRRRIAEILTGEEAPVLQQWFAYCQGDAVVSADVLAVTDERISALQCYLDLDCTLPSQGELSVLRLGVTECEILIAQSVLRSRRLVILTQCVEHYGQSEYMEFSSMRDLFGDIPCAGEGLC